MDYPSKPGESRKTLFYAPQSLVSDTRGAPEAPKKRKRSDLRRKSVEDAIEWLNSPPHIHPDKTRIELYLEKRTAYGKSVKHKDDSYKQALETSKRDPRNESVEDRQAAYDRWVAGNHKRLNAAVQATHMDWVTTANKADVEYHLGIVDLDLDKAVKKVLESQVKFLLRVLCKQHLYSSDFTGGAYVGVLRARFVIPVSVHHLVTCVLCEVAIGILIMPGVDHVLVNVILGDVHNKKPYSTQEVPLFLSLHFMLASTLPPFTSFHNPVRFAEDLIAHLEGTPNRGTHDPLTLIT